MDERLQQLNTVKDSCNLASLTNTYRFVDIWYLRRFEASYLDQSVTISGEMSLDNCEKRQAHDNIGHLNGNGLKADPLRVVFKSMPDVQREFLCTKRPSSQWHGTVEKDAKGIYLYLTDILGVDLP
jgi:hypothetical protein